MKKIISAAFAALLLGFNVVSQEVTVSFENKISSDVVVITDDDTEFAGIKEQVTAEVETEKVNLGVSLITYFEENEEDDLGFTAYELDKAYVEFKPVDFLKLEFNNKVFTDGSYLPVEDDNVGNGNLTSDFSVLFCPVENLSIAGGIRLPSIFADTDDEADIDAGIDFTNEMFSIGATLRSPINDLKFGVFCAFTGVENLALNLGFSYDDEFCDVAGNLLTFGATYEISMFSFGYDFVTNFGDDDNDLHTALSVETGITDSFILETQAALNVDFDDSDATETILEVGAAYVIGNHKFRAGVAFDILDDDLAVYFPVYYKYSF